MVDLRLHGVYDRSVHTCEALLHNLPARLADRVSDWAVHRRAASDGHDYAQRRLLRWGIVWC